MDRMPSILMMAKPEEKNIKFPALLWLISYFTFFALTAVTAFKFFAVWGSNAELMLRSRVFQCAAAASSVSFLLNRYLLYWSRETIIDELLKSGFDTVRSRALTFAPSPFLIWVFGVPYIQSHINRMIKRKGLNSYKKPARTRAKESVVSSKREETEPQPQANG
jgi:hypothetical protein